ncbi:MAG TPA: 3-methyl-2-oxobutanoate hydroxymethyltransferase [Bryobacteraceae bacterium]|nr:3-methyl-2-oxobutanoate hydroxymethyltransferase [Bryobacteraceae bacterium]
MSPHDFFRAKSDGRKITMVTCYDYTFARIVADSPIDSILVGDSAAMVMHGHPTTLTATVDMIRTHLEAVVRGAGKKFVVADLPFLSYRKGLPAAMEAAHTLMAAGAHALKLEGVRGHEDVIERLVQSGIPVMGHLGMQPQSVHAYGGFKAQGRGEEAAAQIAREAAILEELGAFAVVLECIPAMLAERITSAGRIATIGIGAGPSCDGQVLVIQDLLGLDKIFRPRFARQFCDGASAIADALTGYASAVRDGAFPNSEESFT